MNILLTSVGRRSYLVKYFQDALGETGEVHVSNSSSLTPAFLCADKAVVSPLIYEGNYVTFLKSYCLENNIKAIISLFDIDLPILSANIQAFEEIGVKVIVSKPEVIEICNDKLKTFNFLIENGFKAPKTYISLPAAMEALEKGEISYPVMIKPRWGMGSIAVFEAENDQELEVLYKKVYGEIKASYLKYEAQENLDESILIQEKLKGEEYGLDIINNLENKYENTVVKRKFAMRSGETDCAETVVEPKLEELGKLIGKKLGHTANIDVDVFFDGETPYILEMNARFGGGYPFSHMAGVNLPLAIIKWLKNESVDSELLVAQPGFVGHKDIEIVDISKIFNV
ncbi:ATP-grasp domain-containing protein [Jeotgalibaca sp. A122]|uniref:ATP-grasp domain-containing protein n=1 Tax=Jeotgalibaca sp. A122 TaxID=3457322 RepID=UPI003FCF40E8